MDNWFRTVPDRILGICIDLFHEKVVQSSAFRSLIFFLFILLLCIQLVGFIS